MYIEACINPSSTHALGFFNTHKVIFLHTQFNNPPDFSFQLFSISYVNYLGHRRMDTFWTCGAAEVSAVTQNKIYIYLVMGTNSQSHHHL